MIIFELPTDDTLIYRSCHHDRDARILRYTMCAHRIWKIENGTCVYLKNRFSTTVNTAVDMDELSFILLKVENQ